MEFPPDERNNEFDFLIKKAVNYGGLLERIKEMMEQ